MMSKDKKVRNISFDLFNSAFCCCLLQHGSFFLDCFCSNMDRSHAFMCGCCLLRRMGFAVPPFSRCCAETKKRTCYLCHSLLFHDFPDVILSSKFIYIFIFDTLKNPIEL